MMRRLLLMTLVTSVSMLMAVPAVWAGVTASLAGHGAGPGDTVYCGRPVTFNIQLSNTTGNAITSLIHGFRLYSPDGAWWTSLEAAWGPGVYWGDYFDGGIFVDLDGVDYVAPDTVGFFGYAAMAPGVPNGYDDICLRVDAMFDTSGAGKTVCLDSCFSPAYGQWKWVTTGGDILAGWGGPYCYDLAVYSGVSLSLSGPGAGPDDTVIITNQPVTFNIELSNFSQSSLCEISHELHLYSPSGGSWGTIACDTAGGLDAYMNSLDWGCTGNGSGCDTIYIKGLADGRKKGVPNGYLDVILNIEATLNVAPNTDTMCIDSNWYPDWTYWLWADSAGNPLLAEWDGPYCFSTKNWHHTVEGYKWFDQDFGGKWETGEPPLDGWTINIYDAPTGGTILATTTTANGGHYCFSCGPVPGCPEAPNPYIYPVQWIGEVPPTGSNWMQTYPNPAINSGRHQLIPQFGPNGPFNFGNAVEGTVGKIEGCKWEDRDCDSEWDAHEPGLTGWQIELYQMPGWVLTAQATTDANGCYLFDNLNAGDYRVMEVNQFGWWQTYPTSVFHSFSLQQGEWRAGVNFGNDTCCGGAELVDTFFAGTMDDFVGPEPSSPSADLLAQMGNCYGGPLPWFDSAAVNQCFGHTFDGWNPGCCVLGATLCMRLKATGSVPSTDRLMLGDWSDVGTAYAIMMNDLNNYAQGDPSWDPGDMMTVCLDLADLPVSGSWPTTNILALLKDGDLDVLISDDTEVDWLELIVHLCCPCGDLGVSINTGWDEDGQVLITVGNNDDDWRVIETPDGPTNQMAIVKPDAPIYPDAAWIGGPTYTTPGGYYWFEYKFCLNTEFMDPDAFFFGIQSGKAKDSLWLYFNDYFVGLFEPMETIPELGIPHSYRPGCNSIKVKLGTDSHGDQTAFTLQGYVQADSGQCCCYATGDANGDGMVLNITDMTYLMDFVYFQGPPPPTLYEADLNCDCKIDQLDIEMYEAYYIYGMSVFAEYPVPTCCCPDTIRGACCDTLGNCKVLAPDNCEEPPNQYMGDGISCIPNPCPTSCCRPPIRGNVDNDPGDAIDISDLVYLVDYMFTGGPAPVCWEEANVDGSGDGPPDGSADIDISDLVYLVDYMFNQGPPPEACP